MPACDLLQALHQRARVEPGRPDGRGRDEGAAGGSYFRAASLCPNMGSPCERRASGVVSFDARWNGTAALVCMGGPKLGIFCAQSSHFRETTFAVPARAFAQPLHHRGLPSRGSS